MSVVPGFGPRLIDLDCRGKAGEWQQRIAHFALFVFERKGALDLG